MTATRHSFAEAPTEGLDAQHRLAVYGSLAPGEANAHILEPLAGSWCPGVVTGALHTVGWGYALGHRAIRLDPDGPEVPVRIFSSPDLPSFWDELDRFEGADYERVPVSVRTRGGTVDAFIYRWREEA